MGFKTCNFLKKGLQHRNFPVNIAKFLRTRILMKICEQRLLQLLFLTVNISSWVLVSAFNSVGLLQRSSSRFKKFSLRCLVVGSSLIWKKKNINKIKKNYPKWSLVPVAVIPCHSLSLFVIRCHLLSFVVPLVLTRCTTRCLSLPFVASRCNTRCHWMYHSSVFL